MAINPETIPGDLTGASIAALTFTSNSTALDGVDIRDYLGKLKVTLSAGAAADNNQAVTVKLQTSAVVNANFADFDPAVAFTAIAANGAASYQEAIVDTRVAKRYLRAHLTGANGNGRAVTVSLVGKKQVKA